MAKGRKRKETRKVSDLVATARENRRKKGATETLVDQAICATTFAQYKSRIALMEEFFEELEVPISEESFLEFIDALRTNEGGGTSTAEGFRCAALHWQLRKAWPPPIWANSPSCIKAVAGFKYEGGQPKDPKHLLRGTLNDAMFETAISLMDPKISEAAELQTLLAVRLCELLLITVGDWEDRGKAGWWILIRCNKRQRAKSNATSTYWKRVHFAGQVIPLLEKLAQGKRRGDEMFPPPSRGGQWNQKFYNEKLKEAYGKWAEMWLCKFDGSHVLRHTGVGKIIRDCRRSGLEKDKSYLHDVLQMSETMIKWYGRSIEERAGDPQRNETGESRKRKRSLTPEVKKGREGCERVQVVIESRNLVDEIERFLK
jgi:hypothetical protein